MACTNFPSTGLVANVTQHQVGNVTYLYKGGAPTAPIWEAITPPIDLASLVEAQGLFLKAPNGTQYEVIVDNGGVLSTQLVV